MTSIFDPYIPLLAYLAVWGLILVLGYLFKAEKHGMLVKPYYFMLKTVVFNSWMERLGSKYRRAWLTFFDIGAAMGIGLIIFVVYGFIRNAAALFLRTSQASPTVLIVPLPGLTISWEIFPYILISIAVLLIPHEVAHGIASVIDKVPIKSSGVFLAVFLPGGFVEIDEENLAKRKARTKLRVFAAGSSTNVVTWLLVLLLFAGMYQTATSGVLVYGFAQGGGAQTAGIPQWSVITGLNSSQVVAGPTFATVHQQSDLRSFLLQLKAGSNVTVQLSDGSTFHVTTRPWPDNATRAELGVSTIDYHALRVPILPNFVSYHILSTFSWLTLILLGVALVNMLPLFPFDGDRYFETVLGRLGLKNTKNARTVASLVSLGLLGSNLILSYAVFGTVFLGR